MNKVASIEMGYEPFKVVQGIEVVPSIKGYLEYRDEGCEYSSSCLSCVFKKVCIKEEGGGVRYLKCIRDKEIKKLHKKGYNIKSLMMVYGCSERTVFRAIGGK